VGEGFSNRKGLLCHFNRNDPLFLEYRCQLEFALNCLHQTRLRQIFLFKHYFTFLFHFDLYIIDASGQFGDAFDLVFGFAEIDVHEHSSRDVFLHTFANVEFVFVVECILGFFLTNKLVFPLQFDCFHYFVASEVLECNVETAPVGSTPVEQCQHVVAHIHA